MKFAVSAIFWLIFSFLISLGLTNGFRVENVHTEIFLFLLGMLLAIPVTIAVTKWYFREPAEIAPDAIELPLSGTIQSPEYGIPKGYKIQYRGASRNPVLYLDRDSHGLVTGFTVDFGNGLISIRGQSSSIRDCNGNLRLIVTGPGGIQSIGWTNED